MSDMKRGFTLVELLIVIAIIGFIAGISVTFLGCARRDAKEQALVSHMVQLPTLFELLSDTQPPEEGYSALCAHPQVAALINGIEDTVGEASNFCTITQDCECYSDESNWFFQIRPWDYSDFFCISNTDSLITPAEIGIESTCGEL